MTIEARLERCPKEQHPLGYRAAPEYDDLPSMIELCDMQRGERSFDMICRDLAATVSEHEHLYRAVDFVRVMELYGYRRADLILERTVSNRETMRAA